MKNKNKPILGLIVLAIPATAYAVLTNLDDLSVGNTQSNNVYANSTGIGYNSHASWHSLTSGGYNFAHDLSFAAGHSNDVKNISGAIGWQNNVNYDATGQYPRYAFATGVLNYVLGNGSFASGRMNDITADESAAIGEGIVITDDNATVVGTYNEDKASVRFVVGVGADGVSRSNALEVHDDGSVIINQAQGDISMGGFGN